MCQRRQRLQENFNWLSSYCATSSATGFFPIRGECGNAEFCRPLLENLCSAISDCDAEASDIKIGFLLFLPICVSSPCRAPFLSGLRETLAFELLPRLFLLMENTERGRTREH
ncbi:hypothetical protein ILYODFUR_016513 [Ilyodon furcidens]|uniref:Uncharacterized protein n=1 Tax=Ilyodon furcidens TaxID=33524 RepID=A0ABV0SXM5_9TELE